MSDEAVYHWPLNYLDTFTDVQQIAGTFITAVMRIFDGLDMLPCTSAASQPVTVMTATFRKAALRIFRKQAIRTGPGTVPGHDR